MLQQKIKEKIIQNSISLQRFGLNELAWRKKDAQNFINDIMKDKIGILGGDVYKLTPKQLEPLCDNWSCEPIATESEENYHSRSKFESLKYIANYPVQKGEKILFSIIFTEKII